MLYDKGHQLMDLQTPTAPSRHETLLDFLLEIYMAPLTDK